MKHLVTVVMILTGLPSVASAEPKLLSGEEITKLLTNHVLGGGSEKQATLQVLLPDGRTLFKTADKQIEGRWQVVNNMYCSMWPPAKEMSCYEVLNEGNVFSFRAKDGSHNDLKMIK